MARGNCRSFVGNTDVNGPKVLILHSLLSAAALDERGGCAQALFPEVWPHHVVCYHTHQRAYLFNQQPCTVLAEISRSATAWFSISPKLLYSLVTLETEDGF